MTRLIVLIVSFLLLPGSYIWSQYITNCGTNSLGNTYCSYSDGSYEYYNNPGNEYYDRHGEYYHSDEYYEAQEKKRQNDYYQQEYNDYLEEQGRIEMEQYYKEQEKQRNKPTLEEMYGTPTLEEMYGPFDEEESYSSSYKTYSPPNRTSSKDTNYSCHQKYPGTIHRALDNMCICPSGNPFGWDPTTRSCPKPKYTNSSSSNTDKDNYKTAGSSISFDWGAFVFLLIIVGVAVFVLKNIGENK